MYWLVWMGALVAGASAAVQAPPAETLIAIHEGTNLAAALSPDGETLALDLLGSIWVMPVAGGEARRITNSTSDARQPHWAPDGERIVFQAYRGSNWHIWSVQPAGVNLRQHTFGPFDDREPAYSPDGQRIAFSSDRSGNYDIWELDLASGEITQVTNDPRTDYGPVFVGDGRSIAYAAERESGNQILLHRGDGRERVVATVDGRIAGASPSPDGSRLIFNEIANGVSRLLLTDVDDDDDEPRVVSGAGEDVFPFRVAWSTDDEFLYTADGKVKRQKIPGRRRGALEQPEVVEFLAEARIYRPAYERRQRDFDTTAAQPVRGIVSPVVSPAGDAVAFAALGDLWMLAVGADESGEPVQLTSDSFIDLAPTFSPDGQTLAYVSNRAGSFDIWLRDLASGNERPLTDLPGIERAPAFSPDGSTVAFLDEQGRVLAVEVDAGEVATLHAALHMPGRPTWAPDGRSVAVAALTRYSDRFREGRNELLMISLDGDDDRRVTPFLHRSIGTRGLDGPLWSPDGAMLAFTAGSTLWVVEVNGAGEPTGEPRQLTTEIADSLSWTGDAASIVYLHNGSLRRVYLADGRIDDIPLELSWRRSNPTGRRLVHAGRLFDGRSDNLRTDVDILIAGHRIAAVEAHSDALHEEIAGAAEVDVPIIDASNHTVMPGLIEMHAHQTADTNRIWLAYGVTTVREPVAGAYQSLEIREAIAAGVRRGPREYFAGESFDGSRIYYSGSMAVDAMTEVHMQLERADLLGYDLIKTYVRLPDALQFAVVNGAHRIGIPVTSHEFYPALAYGADGVEHIRGTSRRGYSPKVSQLNRSYQDVVELLSRSGMTLTPTMGISGGFMLVAAREPDLFEDPRFASLFPAALVQQATERAAALRANPERQQFIAENLVAAYGDTMRRILDGGGRIIAGTDSPIIPPGVSLHAELQGFVDAGLTPFEALRSATLWAAEALAAGDDLGAVEPGKLADLLIIDGDPLADIRATRNLHIVIKNGEVYSLEDLLR